MRTPSCGVFHQVLIKDHIILYKPVGGAGHDAFTVHRTQYAVAGLVLHVFGPGNGKTFSFSSRCSDVNKVSSTKIFLPWVYPKNIFVNRFVLDISAVPQKLNIVFLCYKNITFLRQYKYTYQIHSNIFNYGRYGFHLEMNRESRRLFYISRSITVGTWPVEETMRTLWESA